MTTENKYDSIGSFQNGIAIVEKDNHFGVVLAGGRELVAPGYDYISPFTDGYAKAIRRGKFVIIDLSGHEYIQTSSGLFEVPEKVFDISECGPGLLRYAKRVKRRNRYGIEEVILWGLMNIKKEIIFTPQFHYIHQFSSGTTKVLKKSKDGYLRWRIVYDYNKLSEEEFKAEPAILEDGSVYVTRNVSESQSEWCRLINETYEISDIGIRLTSSLSRPVFTINGKDILLPKEIYRIFPLKFEHYIIQSKDGKFGAMDSYGNIVAEMTSKSPDLVNYPHIVKFPNGRDVILPEDYMEVLRFEDNNAVFKNGEKAPYCIGCLTDDGELIIKNFNRYQIDSYDKDGKYFILRSKNFRDENIGLFFPESQRFIEPSFSSVRCLSNGEIWVEVDLLGEFLLNKQGFCVIEHDGNTVELEDAFVVGTSTINGLSIVYRNGLWGLYDIESGKLVVECLFEHISYDVRGVYLALKSAIKKHQGKNNESTLTFEEEKYSVFDASGRLMIRGLDNVVPITNKRFVVESCDGVKMLDETGDNLLSFKCKSIKELGFDLLVATDNNDKSYIIDLNGDIVSEHFAQTDKHVQIEAFNTQGIAEVKWNGFCGFMDTNANLVVRDGSKIKKVPHGYDWCFEYKDKLFRCLKSFSDVDICEDSFKSEFQIGCIVDARGNLLIYSEDGKLSPSSQDVSSCIYTSERFSIIRKDESLAKGRIRGVKWGIIDSKNKWIIRPTIIQSMGTIGETFITIRNLKNTSEIAVFNFKTLKHSSFRFRDIKLAIDKKHLYATSVNKTSDKSEKQKGENILQFIDEDLSVVATLPLNTEIVDIINMGAKKYYLVSDVCFDKHYGLVDAVNGEIAISIIYKILYKINENHLMVYDYRGHSGVIDLQGNFIVPIGDHTIMPVKDGGFIVTEKIISSYPPSNDNRSWRFSDGPSPDLPF